MDNTIIYQDVKQICAKIDFQRFANSTVVLTGASGLIGTYFLASLCHLKKQGISLNIHALVYSEPPEHIVEITKDCDVNFIKLDLSSFTEYAKIPKADLIIHTAGYAQPLRFMANETATLQINTSATIALLQQLNKNGSFMFLSSSEVYCDLDEKPFTEERIGKTTPFHLRASYIEGKRGGESATFFYFNKGYNAKSIRLGDIYGPGTKKDDKRAMNSFIRRGFLEKKITLMDSGEAIRNYTYVANAVELMFQIIIKGTQAVYNLGGQQSVSIAEMAKTIGQIMDIPVTIPKKEGGVSGAPKELILDLSRIQREIELDHYIDLKEGLKRTISWQNNLFK